MYYRFDVYWLGNEVDRWYIAVVDLDLQKRGGGVSLLKKFFQPFGPHFGQKIREGCWAAHPSPGSTTSVLTWKWGWSMVYLVNFGNKTAWAIDHWSTSFPGKAAYSELNKMASTATWRQEVKLNFWPKLNGRNARTSKIFAWWMLSTFREVTARKNICLCQKTKPFLYA